ncbi:hypothetical protein N8342_09350 [Acidimicrobiales bacterium]|nr:hypothetical protein [Acidimicrobiales bacterium]
MAESCRSISLSGTSRALVPQPPINHWVETGLPVPAEADRVNAIAVLRSRVDECQTERGRGPGIIAVNFWERGDLLEIVDELNGAGD